MSASEPGSASNAEDEPTSGDFDTIARPHSNTISGVRRIARALTLDEQRDRRRISDTLHDDLQQLLCGLEVHVELLRREVSDGRDNADGHIEERLTGIRELVTDAIEITRELSIEINPPVLRGEGLGAALRWLAAETLRRYGLDVDVELVEGVDTETAEERTLLVQLTRTLLHNVVQHAGVDSARVTLTPLGDDELCLSVRDEGCGADARYGKTWGPVAPAALGRGLRGVRERIRLLGGRLMIRTRPGEGFTASLVSPRKT